MSEIALSDLQASVRDRSAFATLADYHTLAAAFLAFLKSSQPTNIISPSRPNYMFYQYTDEYGHKITRPLNRELFIIDVNEFVQAFERLMSFLDDVRKHQENIINQHGIESYLTAREINKVIYTIQQSIGCVGDAFTDSNQTRKRIGQLFERLIKFIIKEIGLECEPRTIRIPIPDYPDYQMPYELDVVFSRNKAVISSETQYIYANEVVGSVKTTSKDRIDKIFLDKYLLTKLLGREIPVVAVFLHDVQRAISGNSIFGVNSTFKTNHFLGYTVALNRLDGVYYIDPRPEMTTNERLRDQIHDFQQFLVQDLWILSKV